MTQVLIVQIRFGGVRAAQRSVVHWGDYLRHAWADGSGACGWDRGRDRGFGETARKGVSRFCTLLSVLRKLSRALACCTHSCARFFVFELAIIRAGRDGRQAKPFRVVLGLCLVLSDAQLESECLWCGIYTRMHAPCSRTTAVIVRVNFRFSL